jgi:hypothetical protein
VEKGPDYLIYKVGDASALHSTASSRQGFAFSDGVAYLERTALLERLP